MTCTSDWAWFSRVNSSWILELSDRKLVFSIATSKAIIIPFLEVPKRATRSLSRMHSLPEHYASLLWIKHLTQVSVDFNISKSLEILKNLRPTWTEIVHHRCLNLLTSEREFLLSMVSLLSYWYFLTFVVTVSFREYNYHHSSRRVKELISF